VDLSVDPLALMLAFQRGDPGVGGIAVAVRKDRGDTWPRSVLALRVGEQNRDGLLVPSGRRFCRNLFPEAGKDRYPLVAGTIGRFNFALLTLLLERQPHKHHVPATG